MGSDTATSIGLAVSGSASATHVSQGKVSDSLSATATSTDYQFAYTNGSLTITPATITVTGGTTSAVYNGAAQTNTYTTSTLLGSDTATSIGLSVSGSATATHVSQGTVADKLSATATSTDYQFAYSNGSITIQAIAATISATKMYDSTNALTASQVTITGVNNEILGYTGSALANNSNVIPTTASSGKAQITSASGNFVTSGITLANGSGTNAGLASDYVLPSLTAQSTNNSVVITPNTSAVVITGNSNTITYNGSAQSVTGFTATGLVGSDVTNPSAYFTAAGVSGTNAGTYTNTVSGSTNNYSNVTIVNGALNIAKANLTATGTRIFNGSSSFDESLLIISGVNGESFTATGTGTLANAGAVQTSQNLASVGTVTLTPKGSALVSNYNPLTPSDTSVTITASSPIIPPVNPVVPVTPSNPSHAVVNPTTPAANDFNAAINASPAAAGGDDNDSSCKLIDENAPKKLIIMAEVLFDTNGEKIKPKFFGALNKIASDLALKKYKQVVITGHADATGSEKYNQALSVRRAKAIEKYLINHKVAKNMIKTEGAGAANPVASNDTAAGKAQNRRTDVAVDDSANKGTDQPSVAAPCGNNGDGFSSTTKM